MKKNLLLFTVLLFTTVFLSAQEPQADISSESEPQQEVVADTPSQDEEETEEMKYQRSSLAMIVMSKDMNILLKKSEEKSLDSIRYEVVKSWDAYPFPDKYNNHNIQTKDLGLHNDIDFDKITQIMQKNNIKKDAKDLLPKIEKQLQEQKIAQQLVRSWFSAEDGTLFDMEYIKDMGFYNASEGDIDFNTAMNSARGLAMLGDAGENLINNTFVTVTDMIFFSNEPVAENLTAAANALLSTNCNTGNSIADLACLASTRLAAGIMTAVAAGIKDGYTVYSKTFLFKLKWNEEIAAEFYSIWGNEEAFEKMNFELEYIGFQYNNNKVNAGVFTKSENREIEKVLHKALVNNMDKSFATLQKENDVFKPFVPILSADPFITAKIGMKEGLTGKETFAILKKVEDPVTHKMKWQRIGVTKVNKKYIWDNRYNAGDQPEKIVYDKNGQPITASMFKKHSSAQPGMVLKQLK